MPRPLLILCLALTAVSAGAAPGLPPGPPLLGKLANGYYTAPTGCYRIPVLVLPALGGTITDTENLVVFQDDFTTYITVTAIPMDATQHWDLDFYQLKAYLARYFMSSVLPEFKQACPKVQIDPNGIFLPQAFGGAMISYALLPGGSMFVDRLPSVVPAPPPVAKRGFLVFTHDGFTYVITTELAERAVEGTAYRLTPAEEDRKIRERLLEVAGKIEFLARPTKSPTITVPIASP